MPSYLIAVVFPASGAAHQAWEFTTILRDRNMYGLGCVSLITQDADGNTDFQNFVSSDVSASPRQRELLSRLAEMIFDSPTEVAVARLSALGLDGLFVKQVNRSMEPKRSALLIYLPADNLADIDQLMAFLNLMKATVFRTTLPRLVEDALLSETWNGDKNGSSSDAT